MWNRAIERHFISILPWDRNEGRNCTWWIMGGGGGGGVNCIDLKAYICMNAMATSTPRTNAIIARYYRPQTSVFNG